MEAHHQEDGGDHHMMMNIDIDQNMQSHIKRKRTKRPRPSSILLTLSLPSTSSSNSSTTTDDEPCRPPTNYHSSIEFTNIFQENNTNDQDIADCLMLLAHGNHLPAAPEPLNMVFPPPSYVYECNICDRGFASFQALGGHKASHNKPHSREVVHEEVSKTRSAYGNSSKYPTTKGRPRVHECVICGSDFTSGQALGGHMRRHRPIPSIIMKTMTTTITSDVNTMITANHISYNTCHDQSKPQKTVLMLDLNNLPALIQDDHHSETKIPSGSNNQQS